MAAVQHHHCRILTSPWPGVFATDIDSSRHYGRHWHGSYGLGLIDRGAHRSGGSSGAVEAFAGDIVSTNPGEVHDGRPLGTPSRRWRTVYIEPEIVACIAAESGWAADVEFTQAAFNDERVRKPLLALLSAMTRWTGGEKDALACEEALVHACAAMIGAHSTASASREMDASLARVMERLHEGLRGPAPALSELAALAGIGRFQLLRRFRKLFGITPHAWLVQQRAELARTLLAQGRSIACAAAEAGFADQSHLTRAFVQRFGFTPGAWRNAAAQ